MKFVSLCLVSVSISIRWVYLYLRGFLLKDFFRSWMSLLTERSLHLNLVHEIVNTFIFYGIIFIKFLGRNFLESQSKVALILRVYIIVSNFLAFKLVNLVHPSPCLHIMDHAKSICNMYLCEPLFKLLISPGPPLWHSFTLPFSSVLIGKQGSRLSSWERSRNFSFVFIIPCINWSLGSSWSH